jgi:colicin import membrane protein
MKEESWYKMFFVALLLHAILIGAFSVPFQKAVRRFDLSSYSVNLVTDVGDGPIGAGPKSKAGPITEPVKQQHPPATKKEEPAKTKVHTRPTEKERSIPAIKEKTLTPIKKNTQAEPQAATNDEVRSLDSKIDQMRRRNNHYMDVVGKSKEVSATKGPNTSGTGFGSGGVGSGGGTAEEKYAQDVWNKIESLWTIPTVLSLRNDLKCKLTIKIRKDGRIMDWNIDERSSSRMYDESIVRALRSVDHVPPIPEALGEDIIELSYNILPPASRK